MQSFLERRKTEKIGGGWLGIEGAHALDGKVENVDVLFDAGFRMMSPSHFFDNEMGGSAHGIEKYGLTEKGKEMVKRMEQKGMLVDVAHASSKAIDDVLAIATKPVVVSHTGVKGTCDNNRNLSDNNSKLLPKRAELSASAFGTRQLAAKMQSQSPKQFVIRQMLSVWNTSDLVRILTARSKFRLTPAAKH